jgi:hypothetical protein
MTLGIDWQAPNFKRLGVGIAVGVLASSLPLLMVPRGEARLLLLWAVALLVAACALAAIRPNSPGYWALGVGLGLPVVVLGRILVDTIRLKQGAMWPEVEEHTLFPLEIGLATGIGVTSATIGAYLGSLITRGLTRRLPSDAGSKPGRAL